MADPVWTDLIDEFRATFDDPDLTVGPDTTAEDVEGWDSVSNIELIVALEARFGVTFRTGDMAGMKNVGELAEVIAERSGRPLGSI